MVGQRGKKKKMKRNDEFKLNYAIRPYVDSSIDQLIFDSNIQCWMALCFELFRSLWGQAMAENGKMVNMLNVEPRFNWISGDNNRTMRPK